MSEYQSVRYKNFADRKFVVSLLSYNNNNVYYIRYSKMSETIWVDGCLNNPSDVSQKHVSGVRISHISMCLGAQAKL